MTISTAVASETAERRNHGLGLGCPQAIVHRYVGTDLGQGQREDSPIRNQSRVSRRYSRAYAK